MEHCFDPRSLTSICIAMCVATAAAPLAHGQDFRRRVDVTSLEPDPDGLSWPTAYSRLEDALDEASIDSFITEIWLAAGQYKPTNPADENDRTATFTLVNGVAVYGGFDGTESSLTERDPVANDTRLVGSEDDGPPNHGQLDGNRRHHIVTAIDVQPPTRLDGFLIENGKADDDEEPEADEKFGAGLLLKNANPRIIRCTFWHNKAGEVGGAIYFKPSPSDPVLTIINSYFVDNTGNGICCGGAMYNDGGRPAFSNCSFSSNKVEIDGGAIYNKDGTPTFINCTFAGNFVRDGLGAGISAPLVARLF